METGQWTLPELIEQSTLFLNEDGQSNRITWTPNPRQVRYYTTLGLLDKPFGGRGRGNTYSTKHLLQLLAIKQLQHQGVKLAEIQRMLSGLSQAKLAELLRFDPQWLERESLTEEQIEAQRESRAWAQVAPVRAQPQTATLESLQRLTIAPGVEITIKNEVLAQLSPTEQSALFDDLKNTWNRHHREEPKS